MYSGRILVVDLSSKSIQELDLESKLIQSNIGGSGINSELLKRYPDSIVIGTGLLTGIPVMGACLAIISKMETKPRNLHLDWFLGPELKYSGFDFLVIRGRSPNPCYLWIHDELADIQDASDIWGKSSWETTDAIRDELGESRIQVLNIGQAGESRNRYAQLINNYWGSLDKFGIGADFGERNLKAIAVRGMGELELADADGFIDVAGSILDLARSKLKGAQGPEMILSRVNKSLDISRLLHRFQSCFGCPYPCRGFLKYREPPSELRLTQVAEPGIIISDLAGMLELTQRFGLDGACIALENCYKLGLDPMAGSMAKSPQEISELISNPPAHIPKPWGIDFDFKGFTPGLPPIPDPEWEFKIKLGYLLGICPNLLLLIPELIQRIPELIRACSGLELGMDSLREIAFKI